MPSISEVNDFLNNASQQGLAWLQTIRGGTVTVPGVVTQTTQTKTPSTLPTGASTTPSGGTPKINALQIGLFTVAGVLIVVAATMAARRGGIR